MTFWRRPSNGADELVHFCEVLLANLLVCLSVSLPVRAQELDQLIPHNVLLKQMSYRGRSAVEVMADPDSANGSSYAILKRYAGTTRRNTVPTQSSISLV